MFNQTALINVLQTKSQFDSIQYISWHVYGITFAIAFFLPLALLLLISAFNGSLGTKYWNVDFIIPYLFFAIVLILALVGILPLFTAIS